MNDERKCFLIPDGWTYFVHRTNTERWNKEDLIQPSIKVSSKKVMSVVTESDLYQEINHYGKDTYIKQRGYSFGAGSPFEIRCLIPNLKHTQTLPEELKNIILHKFYYDKENFGGAYGQRHHSIPRNEELLVICKSCTDNIFDNERNIIWTIPKQFLELYKLEIKKGNNRVINFSSISDFAINKSR